MAAPAGAAIFRSVAKTNQVTQAHLNGLIESEDHFVAHEGDRNARLMGELEKCFGARSVSLDVAFRIPDALLRKEPLERLAE